MSAHLCNLSEVIDFIKSASADELIILNRTIREVFEQPRRVFSIGDKVKFTSRQGLIITGKVIKVNSKTVKVLSDNTNVIWNVSASLLEKV